MDSCQSQSSWQVSARAVVRSGVGLVSGVDRSPALRLLWVLSALSVPAAPPSCAHRHVARLTSRRPCCSLQQVSTAQLPLNPARLQGVRRHALPPAQLTSAQLTCFRLSLAHLSSAHLPLGALSWPASLGLTSCVEPPATPSTLPPAGMVGQGRRTSRCSTCRGPDGPCGALFPDCATLTSRTPQWTHPSNSSTCEPPVIDL